MKYSDDCKVYRIRYYNVWFYLFAKTEMDEYKINILGERIGMGDSMMMKDIHCWCTRQNIRYEIMDQLNQVIEERVLELKRKSEEDKVPAYCTETKEHVLRMDRILNSLSEDDRQWLDDQLMAKMDIPEQERLRYYKAGLADAIELIHYLRT